MNLPIKPHMRPWIMGCLEDVAAAIGWPATLKAIEVGIAYAQKHPFPEATAVTPPVAGNPVTGTPTPPPVVADPPPAQPPATPPAASSGARLTGVKAIGSMMSVTVEGWEGWPVKGGKKDTYGKLMIGTRVKPSGEYVDALTKSQMRGGRKTLANAYGSGAHSLDVQRGETVQVWVRSWDGRETNKLPFVWCWEST